jgi:pimeloyl-ACP methyl ester carboxylesterase
VEQASEWRHKVTRVVATVVLVHGAWHGAWCWEKVVGLLDDAQVPSIALDLPGHGASVEPLTDLGGDAAALRNVLDQLDAAVVCGHSFGGAVVSEGADHPAARHLVFLAAFPIAPGESVMDAAAAEVARDAGASELGTAMHFADDGTVTVDPELALPALFADCAADDAAKAVARLGPQAVAELRGTATRAAWKNVPSTYVVCTEDRAISPALQRVLAQRCTHTIEWPTSHSPFLSRPELVADLLTALATR